MTIAKEISEFLADSKIHDIPKETVEFTKHLFLKTIAGMLNGCRRPAGRKMASILSLQDVRQEAGVIGCGFRTSVENAILADGTFAHACELEDDQFPSATSDITVIPVIWPLAERQRASGAEIIEAAALSMEIMNRLGMYSLTFMGIGDLSFYGIFGSAAAAAKLLGLSPGQIRSAMGISAGRASGFLLNFGTDAHYLESAMACRDGLSAAQYAQNGMSGGTEFEKWLNGLLGKDSPPLEKITEGLGDRSRKWHVHNMWIKKYPCCFLTHRHNDATFAILEANNIAAEQVAKIEVEIGPIDAVTNRPDPKDEEDARFSIQHIQAGIVLERDLNFQTFSLAKISSPQFSEMRSRVKVNVHEDWPARMMSGTAKVTLATKDGRVFSKEMDQPIGGSSLPLTAPQFEAMYRKLTKEILSEAKVDATLNALLHLDQIDDLQPVMNLLTYPYASPISTL